MVTELVELKSRLQQPLTEGAPLAEKETKMQVTVAALWLHWFSSALHTAEVC